MEEINNQLNIEYFNLNNVVTPYHFKKSMWSGIYRIENNEIKDNLKSKLVFNQNYLINYICDTYNLVKNEIILFSQDVSEETIKMNILSFKIELLSSDNFFKLANNWLKTIID